MSVFLFLYCVFRSVPIACVLKGEPSLDDFCGDMQSGHTVNVFALPQRSPSWFLVRWTWGVVVNLWLLTGFKQAEIDRYN